MITMCVLLCFRRTLAVFLPLVWTDPSRSSTQHLVPCCRESAIQMLSPQRCSHLMDSWCLQAAMMVSHASSVRRRAQVNENTTWDPPCAPHVSRPQATQPIEGIQDDVLLEMFSTKQGAHFQYDGIGCRCWYAHAARAGSGRSSSEC